MNYKLQIKSNKFLVIIFFFTILVFFCCFISSASAATLNLSTSQVKFHQGEQFVVEVSVTPNQNENINSFDVSLSYSSNLTFISSEEGSSIAGLWIEKPTNNSRSINFSGIIPGGFTGLIDPTKSDPLHDQKPGILTRLIFSGNKEGDAMISFNKQDILANDGQGTILGASSNLLPIHIDNKVLPSVIDTNDTNPPEHFTILLSNDSIFNGKYAVLFETKDKESGIDHYEVKEAGSDWKIAVSPYIMENQPPIGVIYVKAVDHNGNSTIEQITPNISEKTTNLYSKAEIIIVILVIIILITIAIVFIKRKKISRGII